MLKERLIEYEPETGRVLSPPRQVFVEITGRCNLACVHCSVDYGRPEAAALRDLPREALHALRPWLRAAKFVNLNIVGEPLLAAGFEEVVAFCREGDAEIGFNTNGLLLSEERARFLVEAGVHSVAFSIDGVETNATLRGARYEAIRAGLLRLARARERAGAERPHIAVATTLLRRNLHELPRLLADLLPRARIHSVHLQPLVVFYETLRGENLYDAEGVDAVVAAARALCARHGVELTLFRSRLAEDERHVAPAELAQELGPWSAVYGCTDPFFEVKVRSTGEVMACSYGLYAPHHVLRDDLDAIWNGPWYRALRRRLHAQRFEGRCTGCPHVHGGPTNQLDSLRPGLHHSRAARFLGAPPRPDVRAS